MTGLPKFVIPRVYIIVIQFESLNRIITELTDDYMPQVKNKYCNLLIIKG